jgi:hypothetical protein
MVNTETLETLGKQEWSIQTLETLGNQKFSVLTIHGCPFGFL